MNEWNTNRCVGAVDIVTAPGIESTTVYLVEISGISRD